ncbi:hypothetical protein BDA99DRAFT_37538 [Phascolomyces articulosus]|uniref:DUF7801 domain-containing protein n=1 Tax=Phascolomyces articulosus TaxID=60185 RepID=A0AAD5KBA3_9FUNG|nr:hypothetical protein BDA99DRAFT_37538 [Phascolomyces articulosus]
MKHNKEDDDDNDDDEPLGNKVTLANALQALRPTSQQSQVSISSLRSFSSADSSSSSDYGDNDDDEDDIQEINRGTSFSTPHTASSNIPGISKPEPTPITASSNTTSTSTTSTAFGITLPWSQYSHAHTLPTPDETTLSSKMMMADSAEIGRQLAVSHAALTAMEFPTLNGIMDAEKWRMKYSRARSKVDSIRDRVLLETNIQRAYSSMLKLAVDHHDRPLVMDIHARSSNIDQLTQELYYTFSHVCESQERYLHHLAGTLAITFQSEDRSWDTTTTAVPQNTTTMTTATFSPSSNNNKKRREDYPDVVLRLEKLAKKCSFSLTSKSNHHHDLFKRSITKSSATTISSTTRRHADSVSDDGNLSDDSMFHTSVRTSMTSFDDYQQAHALLDIIEKQLSIDNTMTYVAGDKSHDNGNAAVLEKELMQLREREADMQHRFDTQSAEFSRQRQEWENKLLQAKQQQPNNTSSSTFMRQQQQKLEQQLTLEVEAREASQKQLKEATLGQQELQKQLDRYRDEAYQAKQRESRLHDEQAALNRRVQELELEVMMATTEPSSSQKQHENRSMEPSSADNDKKISELNQSLLQANRREKELVQKIQELEKEIIYNNERYSSSALSIQQHNSDYQTLMQEKQSIQKELETSKQRENSTRDRLDTLHAQVNQALTKASAPSLDALVTLLLQQHPVSIASSTAPPTRGSSMAASKDNVQQELDQLHAAFKSAQEEYTRREAALMLQSASVEAELGAIFKEYDKLTRNITDFNHERKKYEQHVQALTREKHLLDKQLADFKVKDGIGKDGSTMTLRKEFRQLMAKVKAEHEQEIEKESEKRHQVEIELRNMKHELEMKRWDTVNTGVQTTFVAYPIN